MLLIMIKHCLAFLQHARARAHIHTRTQNFHQTLEKLTVIGLVTALLVHH